MLKDSADIAMAYLMGSLDQYAGMHVDFTIISNDGGFKVLVKEKYLSRMDAQHKSRNITTIDQKECSGCGKKQCGCDECQQAKMCLTEKINSKFFKTSG